MLGNIRLPVLVLAASSPAAGAGANIGISAVAALAAAVTHIRAGRIDWRLFAWMAPPSMVGAVVGGLVSAKVPADALLVAIGVTLLVFGVDLLRPKILGTGAGREDGKPECGDRDRSGDRVAGRVRRAHPRRAEASGAPSFHRADAFRAVGTNAAVGFCLGVAGLLGHLTGGVDWTLLGVGAASSVPGSILGARLTGRLDERQLLRAVGFVLLVAGTAMIAQGIL